MNERAEDPSTADLDRIDMAILRALQADGRLSNADLAQRCNISPATCHRRVRSLTDRGAIRGTRAEIAPEAVGLETLVMVGAVLDRSTPDAFSAFEDRVRQIPAILDCILVAGEFDYLMKVRVRDIGHFNRLHGKELISLPGVRQIRTFFALKEVRGNGPLPF